MGHHLEVVLNRNGEVVVRSVNNDPYGGEQFDLRGAAIDRVGVKAAKDAGGNLTSVTVTMRSTEQLAAATIASGARLAVVDSDGVVLRTVTATAPSLAASDPFTIEWTLTPAAWSALTDPGAVTIGGTSHTPASLSVAATTVGVRPPIRGPESVERRRRVRGIRVVRPMGQGFERRSPLETLEG